MTAANVREIDKQLVLKVQHGDKRCFDLLVLKYQHKVLGLVCSFVRNQTEAEDVTQEVFIKAYRSIHNFRGESAFYTWLYRIAVNAAKNALNARRRRPNADIDIDSIEGTPINEQLTTDEGPETLLAGKDLQLLVESTLATLPEDLRRALVLREFDGLHYDAIAKIMACPTGTVRSRIFRAREAINRVIQPQLEN